jgi:ATP-dependent Lon protease
MKELPLFPLTGVVLFPGSVLPLHIFEHRYRRMIKDVSERDSRFGVINTDGSGLANVGCVAQILKLEKLPDGRSNIIAVGVERFSLVRETDADDYPRAVVKEFREISKPTVTPTYVNKASSTLLEVLKLIARLNKRSPDADIEIPKDPKNLSFLIASSLPSLPFIKQDLLEMQDTNLRLAREIPILEDFRDHLRAVLAIEDAFKNSPESLL